jgi:GDSL-like Lipase/Acylhydrolase family
MTAALPVNPPRRKRVWLRRIAITLVVGVVLAEILLRLIFGFGSPLLYQADAACEYLPKPDQHLYRFFAHNDINHASMRSPDFIMPRPNDSERFLFIGDSVTYGTTYVDQSLIFTSRLAATLPGIEHKPVEVLNASAGGWGVGNEVGYLQSRGTFDANVVLIVLNTGDPGQPTAEFPHDLNFPTERPWTAIGELWSRYLVPRIFDSPQAGDPGTVMSKLEEELKNSEANMHLLDQAHAFCQKSGTLFALVYVPFAGTTGPIVDRAHNTLVDWTRTHNVPFVDVSPAFSSEKVEALTFDGMHLRSYGDEVVARDIAKQWGIIDAALATTTAPATSR